MSMVGLPRGRDAEVTVAGKRLSQYSDASATGTGAGSKALGEQKDGAPDERWLSSCRACAVTTASSSTAICAPDSAAVRPPALRSVYSPDRFAMFPIAIAAAAWVIPYLSTIFRRAAVAASIASRMSSSKPAPPPETRQ